jgi:hypothetical protein
MPIVTRTPPLAHPNAAQLEQRLTAEWKNPQEQGQPVIIMEGDGRTSAFHLFVIWDEWGDMEQNQRSEIILKAFEAARTKEDALKVTVALGLSAQEAKRMGIQ